MNAPATFVATYQGGVLVPERPLPLAEGATIRVSVSPALASDDALQRMKSATTVAELVSAHASGPAPPEGYDLLRALDENRRLSGERPLRSSRSGEEPE